MYYEKNGTLITVQSNGVPKTGDKFESGKQVNLIKILFSSRFGKIKV